MLTFLAAMLLIAFRGITDRLIPLFAVGAFLAFTLAQAGMVAHWKRRGGRHARHSMLVNGLGATATAISVMIVVVSKFLEGAWVTLLAIPGILLLMRAVRRHHDRIERELASPCPLPTASIRSPIVVVPIEAWSRVTQKALRFALESLKMNRESTSSMFPGISKPRESLRAVVVRSSRFSIGLRIREYFRRGLLAPVCPFR